MIIGAVSDEPSRGVSGVMTLASTGRPPMLTGTELFDWMSLRRVDGGGVALHGSTYVDGGRRMPCFHPEVFDRLASAGLIELHNPDFRHGPRRVALTLSGQARFAELNSRMSALPRLAASAPEGSQPIPTP